MVLFIIPQQSHEEIKKISFKDIMGISLAIKNNYKVAIISGEKNSIIDKVADKFNLDDVHQGIKDKLAALYIIADKYSHTSYRIFVIWEMI